MEQPTLNLSFAVGSNRSMSKKFYIALGIVAVFTVLGLIFSGWSFDLKSVSPADPVGFLAVLVPSAIADSINPCALSVLFITIAFLSSAGSPRRKILQVGSAYILGIYMTYLLIGLGILRAMTFFGMPNFASKIAAGLLVAVGLIEIFGAVFPNFPIRFKIPNFAHGKIARFLHKGSFLAIFLVGVLVALFEFPCTGGPYLLILGLLHDSGTYLSGLVYLLLYNLIFVMPIILMLILGSEQSFTDKLNAWRKDNTSKMKIVAGFIMLILAIVIFLI